MTTTAVEIRLLGLSDLDLILTSDAFDKKPDVTQTNAFLTNDHHIIVGAIWRRELVGFASGVILLHPDKTPALFISEVGVNEEHQRRGIARKLVDKLIQHGRNLGCIGTWVATERNNAAARALYRKLDARETKDIVVYDWDGAMDD